MSKIDYIEAHDACLDRMSILPGSVLRMDFNHICVFIANSPTSDDVWSYSACLRIEGLHHLECSGELTEEDACLDSATWEGGKNDLRVFQEQTQVTWFEFVFCSGTVMKVQCKSAVLENLAPIEIFEAWPRP